MAEVTCLVICINKGNVKRNGCKDSLKLRNGELAGRELNFAVSRDYFLFCLSVILAHSTCGFHLFKLVVCKLKRICVP